jgi:methylmalonyl-CoA mutase
MEQQIPYIPKNKVRIVTAASFLTVMMPHQYHAKNYSATGVEVIHLGHDRSVEEVVNTAIQEDANAIAMTSYQGGHNEYFKYMYDLLQEKGAGHIKIFGGGGGVILPAKLQNCMIMELQEFILQMMVVPWDCKE